MPEKEYYFHSAALRKIKVATDQVLETGLV